MVEGYKIIWTDEALKALKNLQSILQYLAESWSSKEIDHFLEKLYARELLLSNQPEAFSFINKRKNYRRGVLTNQTIIYYKLMARMLLFISFPSRS